MFAPGALVTAITKKELKETKVGIAFVEDGGKVLIDEIVQNSLAQETNLKKGYEMLRIENFECLDKKQSADLLRLKSGILSMLARVPGPPQATAYYATATVPSIPSRRDTVILIGLDLIEDEKSGAIFISDIDKNGPFADSKLRVGMELVSINNIRPHCLADARALLDKACEFLCLTILAKHGCRAPPGTLVVATVTKEQANQTLGILMGMNEEQKVVIKRIQDGSLISKTKLEPGMIIHSVGNIPTRGRHNSEVSRIMAGIERHVTILAEAPAPNGQCPTRARTVASLFVATFYKRLQNMNVGLKLTRKNGRMVIASLEEGGLGAATGLQVGMSVLKVNNEDCTTMPVEEATSLYTEVDGIVTILAHQEPPIRQLVTASFVKTKDSKVGIRLRAFKGSVAITYIVKDTLAASTDLLGGMIFRSINNVDCVGKQPEEVRRVWYAFYFLNL
jgi:C-terminal processing protease CtpA/Prc